jgi:hypothetical protein
MSSRLEHILYWWRRSYSRATRSLMRRLRYRSMPAGGWGRGWRVLVFRYSHAPRDELHVLAPVNGEEFDWETLRLHVRGEPWPQYRHEPGKKTGVMGWIGHHTLVTTPEFGNQRMGLGRLVPGEFRGGTDVGFTLIDVRDAGIG